MGYYINITNREWLTVFIFGFMFGGILGGFISLLINIPILNGIISGLFFGIFIFIYSYIFVNSINKYVLNRIDTKFWTPISLFVSFLAGFFGSLTSFYIIKFLNLIFIKFSSFMILYLNILTGLLTMIIGYLLYTIVNSKKIEEELKKTAMELKLKALEYQINPHFLFNTLNTLSELVYINPSLAEKGLLKLSIFLRSLIDESSIITVHDELKIVKNFIFIEKLRFPDIEFEFNIDKNTLNLKVLKLSIQILVENAIKHGVRNKGKIIVSSYIRDGNLYVEVKDNGKGFDSITEGTGLKNLRERLYLFFSGKLEYFFDGKYTVFRFFYKIQ